MPAKKMKKSSAKSSAKKAAARKPAAAKAPEVSSDLRKVALAHALRRLK